MPLGEGARSAGHCRAHDREGIGPAATTISAPGAACRSSAPSLIIPASSDTSRGGTTLRTPQWRGREWSAEANWSTASVPRTRSRAAAALGATRSMCVPFEADSGEVDGWVRTDSPRENEVTARAPPARSSARRHLPRSVLTASTFVANSGSRPTQPRARRSTNASPTAAPARSANAGVPRDSRWSRPIRSSGNRWSCDTSLPADPTRNRPNSRRSEA